jgi:hypothetical protein
MADASPSENASRIIGASPAIESDALPLAPSGLHRRLAHFVLRRRPDGSRKPAAVGAPDHSLEVEASGTLLRQAPDAFGMLIRRIRAYAERYGNSVNLKRPSDRYAKSFAVSNGHREDEIGAVTD